MSTIASLSTQWYPSTAEHEDETENKLLRELVRQGVLIAAREELGMITRDETLGEPLVGHSATSVAHNATTTDAKDVASKKPADPLSIWLEVDADGTWTACLFGAGVVLENPVWKHAGKVGFNKRTIYPELAQQMTEACATIAEQLRKAGASGQPAKLNPDNKPSDDTQKKLESMDFVSQFSAVRTAHKAMRDKGPSFEWMGVLVRGYANLAMLTQHTWSSHYEAFSARSLLYAERMCQMSGNDLRAQWHRAYALAVIGAHGAAIDELDSIGDASAKDRSVMPSWTLVVAPFVSFEHEKLEQVATAHPELKQTVALLDWNLYRSYMHGRWIYEHGVASAQQCPEAYGIYSVMANWSSLRTQRVGSSLGVAAFGKRLPARVLTLDDLPAEASALGGASNSWLTQLLGGTRSAELSDRPIRFSQALKSATAAEATPTECSWSILAELIAEEQYVEAADLISVSGNAVESSKTSLVDRLLPLIEGHRYAAYIRSYVAGPHEFERSAKMLQEILVVDPRVQMQPMFKRIWHVSTSDGKNGNELAWRSVWARDFTLPSVLDMYYDLAVEWTSSITADHRRSFAEDFRAISPRSPNALRLEWETNDQPTAEVLARFESQLKDDPVGWMTIGQCYYRLTDFDASERCYKRSLEISRCYDSTVGLANSYYYNNKKDLWQPTLESYLEVEDLGLAHAQIHQQIAEEHIRQRNWAEAEPHAVAAADTYAAWGLLLAAGAYEGKQDWKKSEYFVAEATRSYPSYSCGTSWYFWCQRNGRGDLAASRALAEQNIQLAATQTRYDDAYRTFTFRLLEGDKAGALQQLDQQIANCLDGEPAWDTAWRLMHVIAVSSALKDSDRTQQAISELKSHVQETLKPANPNWVLVFDGLCSAFSGERPDEQYYKVFEETLHQAQALYRCNYNYFLGAALDQLGEHDRADIYWRRAAFGGPYEYYNSTLAGHELVARHGPDRGGIPPEFLAIEQSYAKQIEKTTGDPLEVETKPIDAPAVDDDN